MKKIYKVLPFIFLILYTVLIKNFNFDWITKFSVLTFMILLSVFTFKKIRKTTNKMYLYFGLLSAVLMSIYLFNN